MKTVDKQIFRVRENLVSTDKVVFLFTAMGTRISLYNLFIRVLNRRGYSCVVYDYPIKIVFDANEQEWQRLFAEVMHDAQEKLNAYKEQGYVHFYAYGVSMGTLFAHKFARDTREISHVVLNLIYGDVADNLWTYRGVLKTRKNLIKQGYTRESARAVVAFIDPIVNAPQLKGKKVLLYLSKPDRVMVYEQTQHTLRAFRESDLNLEYVENKFLGHYIGAAKNMMSMRGLERFLRS